MGNIFLKKLIDAEEESKDNSLSMFQSTRDSCAYGYLQGNNKKLKNILEEKVVKINISKQKPDDKN